MVLARLVAGGLPVLGGDNMGWIIGGVLAVVAFLVWFGLVQVCEALAGEVD